MAGDYFVGNYLTSVEDNGKMLPVSRVTLMVDSETAVTAGDDSGYEIRADCPFATQTMADMLLARLRGYRYQMFSADAVSIDPAAELGDTVTVGGLYGVISHVYDDGSGAPDVTAPGEAELEDEYPTEGPLTREFNLKIARTNTRITKTASDIRLEVADLTSEMASEFVTELTAITGRVNGLDGTFSEFKNTVDGFTVTDPSGTTRIKGSSIDTESLAASSITADKLNLTGAITFFDLNSSVYNRLVDGITKDAANTLITNRLVSSPDIAGARFMNLDQDTWIAIDAEWNGGGVSAWGFTLNTEESKGNTPVFGVYNYEKLKRAGLKVRDFAFIDVLSGSRRVDCLGNWNFGRSLIPTTVDFSYATVSGLTAVFA